MKKLTLLSLFFCPIIVFSQDTLPNFRVVNSGGNIIVSWKNNYKLPIATLNIQRSFDSLKNYTTIGSVLTPGSLENGFTDNNPPYNKMYYRIFIGFEGGTYVITEARRPVKLALVATSEEDSATLTLKRFQWQADPLLDSLAVKPGTVILPGKDEISYPSKRIFTNNSQMVVIHLPDAMIKNYRALFFDDKGKKIIELTRLKEEFLILEKVYFMKPGWFTFELYENGELVEKNKLQILKDKKATNGDPRGRGGNR